VNAHLGDGKDRQPSGTPGPQSSVVLATQKEVAVRITESTSPIV